MCQGLAIQAEATENWQWHLSVETAEAQETLSVCCCYSV